MSDEAENDRSANEGAVIRRLTTEELAAVEREGGPKARQQRYIRKLADNGLKKNSFVYPVADDERVKTFVQYLRDTQGQPRPEIDDLLRGLCGK